MLLLAMMLGFAGVAPQRAENRGHPVGPSSHQTAPGIRRSRRFSLRHRGRSSGWELSDLSDLASFNWYPAGDGKYELAVIFSTGPEIATLTIYWREAPRGISWRRTLISITRAT